MPAKTIVLAFVTAMAFANSLCGCSAGTSVADAGRDADEKLDLPDSANDFDDSPFITETGQPDDVTDDDGGSEPFDPCPEGWTNIDFPCSTQFACAGIGAYSEMETYWCEPEDCCSGGECLGPSGGDTCPVDSICLADEEGNTDEPCYQFNCGRTGDPECPQEQFCERIPGNCVGPGVCIPVNSPYQTANHVSLNSGVPGRWTCGCDGRTYLTDYRWDYPGRITFGINIAHFGECSKCDQLGFTSANPDHFTKWLACTDTFQTNLAGRLKMPDMEPDLVSMMNGASQAFEGSGSLCADDGNPFLGELVLDESGAISKDQFDRLCRLSTYYGIRSVTGL